MRFFRLLSFRLFVIIFVILAGLTVAFSYYYVSIESSQYEEFIRQCAKRTSEIIRSATRRSMLDNHKDYTFDIINTVSHLESVNEICIYDKKGKVVFSTNSEKTNRVMNMENDACVNCHEADGRLRPQPVQLWHRIYPKKDGTRILGYITPIINERSCYEASCHAHSANEKYLGVLDISLSLQQLDEQIGQNRTHLITTMIAITLFSALVVGSFIWFFVHIPVKKLLMGTQEISSGNIGYKIPTNSNDEIGVLANSFNQMSAGLEKAKKEITAWSEQLEQRVKEKTKELERTQKRNIQIEKMASLGQLSATVAHELNNPLAGILTYSKLIAKKLQKSDLNHDEKQSLLDNLKMIQSESQRSGEIVKNMLLFSRQSAVNFKPHDINRTIDESIELVRHHLKLHNIRLTKEYQDNLPQFEFDDNQIKQALLALYVNAVEAIGNDGSITIRTSCPPPGRFVHISINDTGKGIPEELRPQIFEPFFSTKSETKGVGLGLFSVYAIVQKHEGEITVESGLNRGTTFTIKLPFRKKVK